MELYLHSPLYSFTACTGTTCEIDLLFHGFKQSAVYSDLFSFPTKLERELELKYTHFQ